MYVCVPYNVEGREEDVLVGFVSLGVAFFRACLLRLLFAIAVWILCSGRKHTCGIERERADTL
jgi:hypothetical protein